MKETLGYGVMCLIWGTTWMAIKVGLNDMNPFFSLALRYLAAAVCLAVYLFAKDRRISIERKGWSLIAAITSFNYVIPYSLVYWGEQFIYSDLTSIIFAMLPLNVAALSCLFYKQESFSRRELIGVLIGFGGVVTIFSDSLVHHSRFHFYGGLAVYLSSLSQAVMILILRKHREKFHPLRINLVPLFLTGIIVLALSLLTEDVTRNAWTFSGVASIFFLSVFGTVIAFTIYFWLIQRIRLSAVSAMAYVLPVVAIAVGWVFLGEALTALQLVSSFLILSAVVLTTWKKAKA